jgi:hypothetical protein
MKDKGFYLKKENGEFEKIFSTHELLQAFNSGKLFECDGMFVKKVEWLDTYNLDCFENYN